MSRKTKVVGIFLLTILIAQASFAANPVMGDPEHGVKSASTKLWRGVINFITAPGEIIRQPIVCTMDDGPVGIPVGLVNGVFMTLVRAGSGVIDVVTFPVPLDETIGYDSLLDPDYVWQRAD